MDPNAPAPEIARLETLHAHAILDTPPEPAYDDIAQLAAAVAGTPIALVSFIDEQRNWVKAAVGVDMPESPRDGSLCDHVVVTGKSFAVADVSADTRFAEHSFVADLGLRSYAGTPICARDGLIIGVLCVADTKPRTFSGTAMAALETLARQAAASLEMRGTAAPTPALQRGSVVGINGVSREVAERKERERELARAYALRTAVIDSGAAVVWQGRAPSLQLEYVSAAAETLLGLSPDDWVNDPQALFRRVVEEDRARVLAAYQRLTSAEGDSAIEYRVAMSDGSARWLRDVVRTRRAGGELVVTGVITDGTQQKQTELQLASAEELFRLAAQATGDVIYDWNITNDQVWRSANAETLFGDQSRVIGNTLAGWKSLLHPDDVAAVSQTLSEALLDSVDGWAATYRLRRADGTYAHVDERGRIVRDEDGRATRMIGVMSDRTASVEGAEAVRASEERYRLVVESVNDIIFELDAEFNFQSLNSAFERVTGYAVSEWVGRPAVELVRSAHVDVQAALSSAWTKPGETLPVEIDTASGARVVLELVFTVVDTSDGSGRIVGVARDVTERLSAIAERERLSRQIELLLQSTTEGIFGIDVDGRCTFVNNAGAALLGYTVAELLGEPLHDIIHHVTQNGAAIQVEDCAIRQVSQHGNQVRRDDEVFWTKQGGAIPIEYSASPVYENGRLVAIVTVFSNISERQLLQRRLEQEKRLSSLGRLAATVAHEFNNVLMSIQPHVELARRATVTPQVTHALDSIAQSVARGKKVTQDILRFSRPSEPARAVFAAGPWLRSLTDEHQRVVSRHAEVRLITPPYEIYLDADPGQLHQVLSNLILNARDAIAPRSGRIEISIERCLSAATYPFGSLPTPDAFARIVVADDGAGMSEEILAQVFEPLFTTKRNGTGLGLAVAHQIVTRAGGYVFAESTVGSGSTFHLFIPLARIEGDEELDAAHPSELVNMRALAVEDDDLVADGLLLLLELAGCDAVRASSGTAALELLAANRFDLVVLDVDLPDMSGAAVYEHIATLDPRPGVIFSTGDASHAAIVPYLSSRGVAALVKPYQLDDLLRTATEVISAVTTRE